MKEKTQQNLVKFISFLSRRKSLFTLLGGYEWWLKKKWPSPDLAQTSYLLTIHSIRELYQRKKPVVWTSLFFPSEFIWAGSMVPFYPEIASGLVAALRWSDFPLRSSFQKWVSADLCSYHRLSLGMSLLKLFPRPDFLIATNTICQGTVGFFQTLAQLWRVPFYLIDVPFADFSASEKYISYQLESLAQNLSQEWGIRFRWEQVFSCSNQTRAVIKDIENLRKQKTIILAPPTKNLDYLPYYYQFMGTRASLSFFTQLLAQLSLTEPSSCHRLLWLHLKPFYPNPVPEWLEKNNLGVAFEEFASLYPGELSSREPFSSLARKILYSWQLTVGRKRISHVLQLVQEFEVQGVVQFNQWGCRQSQGMNFPLRQALRKQEIPFLELDGDQIDQNHRSDEQWKTRIQALAEMLEGNR
ncbi:MAG: hypothetical protein PWP04_222 [Candidatus Atribacteria bacterium]|nr:hypothetical protein [Candidatus Atribacteria bacterium]